MSFDSDEIAEDFHEASGMGRREWLDASAYSFRGGDAKRAANAAWMREWRRRKPGAAREADRRKYERLKADAERYARRLELNALRLREYRSAPEVRKRVAADCLARYYRLVADPVKRAALRKRQREAYRRRRP